jgi:SAM-dependent methyltransferase
MLNEFCTLFDANYLSRGLTLYRSLERTCDDFRLRVFCMDDTAKQLLDRLELPRLEAIPLSELEAHDQGLVEVKPTRGPVDYLLTATPAICLYSLEREPSLDAITYLDADLMFFGDPEPLFEELGSDSVLITPHRYSARWKRYEALSGIYNVQFVTFRNDERGLETLRWWRDRCLEWCYFRAEDGKLGDQKYLDDWPQRFPGVHVLAHPGGGLAPWNVDDHQLAGSDGSILVDGTPLVFHHYHSLHLYSGIDALRRAGLLARTYHYSGGMHPLVWRSGYPLSSDVRKLVWNPYLSQLGDAIAELRTVESGFDRGFERLNAVRIVALGVRRRIAAASERLPGALAPSRRYAETWRNADVARRMAERAQQELATNDAVPPFRAFVQAVNSLVREFPLPDPARILDFGCGVGQYSELLDRQFPGRFDYTGCDYSEDMVALAHAQWPSRHFVVNDIFENQLDLDAFDVVFASALVDVLPDYERALDVLLGSKARYVLLHRQRITGDATNVRIAAGYPGQRTYRTVLNLDELGRIAERNGRTIARQFPVDDEMQTFLLTSSTS